jgi:hypothetical protein
VCLIYSFCVRSVNKTIEQNILIPTSHENNLTRVGKYEGQSTKVDDSINCQNARIELNLSARELTGKLHIENGPSLPITGGIDKNKIYGHVTRGVLVVGAIQGNFANEIINIFWINEKCKTSITLQKLF